MRPLEESTRNMTQNYECDASNESVLNISTFFVQNSFIMYLLAFYKDGFL